MAFHYERFAPTCTVRKVTKIYFFIPQETDEQKYLNDKH